MPVSNHVARTADCVLAFDLLTAADSKNTTIGRGGPDNHGGLTSKTLPVTWVYDATVAHPGTESLLARLTPRDRWVHFDALAAADRLFRRHRLRESAVGRRRLPSWRFCFGARHIRDAIGLNGVRWR